MGGKAAVTETLTFVMLVIPYNQKCDLIEDCFPEILCPTQNPEFRRYLNASVNLESTRKELATASRCVSNDS